jgi:hypothetical protein
MQDKGCPTSMFISLSGIEIFVVHPFFCRTFSIKRHMSLKGVIFDDKKFKTKGNRGYTTFNAWSTKSLICSWLSAGAFGGA